MLLKSSTNMMEYQLCGIAQKRKTISGRNPTSNTPLIELMQNVDRCRIVRTLLQPLRELTAGLIDSRR
jgi:hypothetical protein